jgi:hypothetical protein
VLGRVPLRDAGQVAAVAAVAEVILRGDSRRPVASTSTDSPGRATMVLDGIKVSRIGDGGNGDERRVHFTATTAAASQKRGSKRGGIAGGREVGSRILRCCCRIFSNIGSETRNKRWVHRQLWSASTWAHQEPRVPRALLPLVRGMSDGKSVPVVTMGRPCMYATLSKAGAQASAGECALAC